MREAFLIGFPAACLLTAVGIGVGACVLGGRTDDALERHSQVRDLDEYRRARYSDGSPYDQDALNLDVLADALSAPAFTDEKCGAGPRTRRR